ncbi:MAG: hypothetical protein ACK4ST_05445 [Elioraea tepidiphila]
MSAFAAAMEALVADPNLGTEAVYRQGGSGTPISLRVLRSSPDRVTDAFGSGILSATDILSVTVAVLPAVDAGDSFTLGPDTLTVQHAERDAAGIAWRVLCQR